MKILNKKPITAGRYVLYWMQSAQRLEFNDALEFAVETANKTRLPLLVLFCICPDFPSANARHFYFMLEGIKDFANNFKTKNIKFVIKTGDMINTIAAFAKDSCCLITDTNFLTAPAEWRIELAEKINCRMFEVETNLIVPVETVSEKQEYSAKTIRPKIHKHLENFLILPAQKKCKADSNRLLSGITSIRIEYIDALIKKLKIDTSVSKSSFFTGGISQAKKHLKNFIDNKLFGYVAYANNASKDYQSNLSPYLHFGQISPLYVAMEVLKSSADKQAKEKFLEQLIVRRELAYNFIYYCSDYDKITSTSDWAKNSLALHDSDRREYVYTLKQLEEAQTHDIYWNAAQKQMLITGKMHGYMRMYWGKKIIEWSPNSQTAYSRAIYLNDKYSLDGRDANGYAGICWCFGKHDTAWKQRPIFGKVRYMNAQGLKRKFDMEKYIEQIDRLASDFS